MVARGVGVWIGQSRDFGEKVRGLASLNGEAGAWLAWFKTLVDRSRNEGIR